MTAPNNIFVIYHRETGAPRMIVKDAVNVDDPAWLNVNNDPSGHTQMHMDRAHYDTLEHHELQAHLYVNIPLHKSALETGVSFVPEMIFAEQVMEYSAAYHAAFIEPYAVNKGIVNEIKGSAGDAADHP